MTMADPALEISSTQDLPYLHHEEAVAACVLWGSNLFNTADIAQVLKVSESAVSNTLAFAREAATERAGRKIQ